MSLSIKWRIKRWLLRKITRDIYAVHINESNGFVVLYKGSGHGGVAVGIQTDEITAHEEGHPHRRVYWKEACPDCKRTDAIKFNEHNGVTQCHSCGTVIKGE